jgi:hypothetical protein
LARQNGGRVLLIFSSVLIHVFAAGAEAQDRFAPIDEAIVRSLEEVDRLSAAVYFELALQTQLSSFPIASSSGAFAYTFDPVARAFTRRNQTFGPTFVERATTLGRRRAFVVGGTIEPVTFSALDGRPLGDSPFYNRFRYPDGRVVTRTLAIDLRSVTVAGFTTFAVAPALDVTVIVPVSRVTYRGVVRQEVTLLDTGTVSSTRAGDIEARAKWNPVRLNRVDLSAQYAIRVATGKGGIHSSGRAQQKLAALLSARLGSVHPHLNLGYAFKAGGQTPGEALRDNFLQIPGRAPMSNEAIYGFGFEWAAHPRVTLTVDGVGRLLFDSFAFREVTDDRREPIDYLPERPFGFFLDRNAATPSNVHAAIGAAGAKLRLAGNTLISWRVLFPLVSGGLRPGFSSILGWEYGY